MHARIDLADIAVGADLDVELAVRSERGVFPVVMDFRREIELVGEIDRVSRIVELVLDIVVTQHLVDGEHIERAVLEGEAVGLGQSLQQDLDLALAVLFGDGIDAADQRACP